MRFISKIFGAVSMIFLILAGIHAALLLAVRAYVDYGWLGVVVIVALGFPFVWLVPIVGWWFLPAGQMIWLMIFLGIFLLSAWGKNVFENIVIKKALEDASNP